MRARLGCWLLVLPLLLTACEGMDGMPGMGGMMEWMMRQMMDSPSSVAPQSETERGSETSRPSAGLPGSGLGTEDVEATGARVYAVYCAVCHGKRGEGGLVANASPLDGAGRLPQLSDLELFSAIAEGRPGTPMKAWARQRGGELTDDEIRAVVTFLRSRSPGRQR